MILYKTVAGEGSAECVISKSRFIAHVKPIESYEEGQTFVSEIKEKHRDATHNVPAIVYGNKLEHQWMSDDGEPSGTAGTVVLKLLVDEGITNTAVVVTRYFGGIKLGTGGLSRAYRGIAKQAIEETGIAHVSEGVSFEFVIEYALLDKVKSLAAESDFSIENEAYSERVTLTVATTAEKGEALKKLFNDLSSGKCVLLNEKNTKNRSKIC